MAKPLIRTIHHLAASGGTMMSRAIAANASVYLLSEIHPFSPRGTYFNPIDPLQHAINQYQETLKFNRDEVAEAFILRLKPVMKKVAARGGYLVLRDHAHSDWMFGPTYPASRLLEVLRPYSHLQSIVTLRNPVETYLSLLPKNWHYDRSFDEFCGVLRQFLAYFAGTPVFHYEDFVQAPDAVLQRMLAALSLPYDPGWRERYPTLPLTGDSGRGGEQAPIEPKPMRAFSEAMRQEVLASENYAALCATYGYYRDPAELRQAREDLLAAAAG